MQTKGKMKKVIDLIIEKKDPEARTELKKIIQAHPKRKAYRKALSEMGLDFKTAYVPDEIYLKIESAIAKFHPEVQKKIIDRIYIDICKKEKNNL